MKYFKLKFLLLFAALAVAIPSAWAETVTDEITLAKTGITGTGYKPFSNLIDNSNAVYAGYCSGGNSAIQLNYNSNGYGVWMTASGGKVKSVTIDFNTATAGSRTLRIYGKHVAYTRSDITDSSGRGSLIAAFKKSNGISQTVDVTEDFEYLCFTTLSNDGGALYIDKITVVWDDGTGGTVEKVATPTFSVETGTYTEAQTVAISCETEGATIYYTTDGTNPTTESTEYSEPITISSTTTLKAIAVKDGMDNSNVATATYTFLTVVTNLADANALAVGTNFVYNGYAVVTHVVDDTEYSNADIWIRDDQGNAAYLFRGKPTGLAKGDVLESGWTGSRANYNGLKELTDVTLTKSGTAEVNPLLVTEIKESDVSKFVRLENVSEIPEWFDKFHTGKTLDASKTYNVEGIVGYYNRLQFWPITVDEVEAPVTELEITLSPAEANATAGEDINVTVTANVEDVLYEYTVTPATATLTETENGFTLTSATAGEFTVSVYGTDGNLEKTVSGTYTFTAAPEPGVMTTYKKVNSAQEITDGSKYLIVYEDGGVAFDGSLDILDGVNNTFAVTITEEKIETDKAGYFIIDKTEGSVKSASNHFIGRGGDTNGLDQSDEALTNTISMTGTNVKIEGAKGAILRYNPDDNQQRFRYFKSTSYSNQKAIQLYKEMVDEPVVPELGLELNPAEGSYTVGDNAVVFVTVENGNEDTMVTYKINNGEDQNYNAETGIVLPNDKAGEVALEVYATDGDREATASGTYNFAAANAFVITLTPDGSTQYYVGDEVNVKVGVQENIGNVLITYTITDNRTEETYDPELGINIPSDKVGEVLLTVNVTDGYDHQGESTATATYNFVERPVAAAPEFSLVSGSYGTAKSLEITSADGATIYYTTDGTEPTTASTQYTSAIELGEGETIIKAIAVKEGMTNSAVANAYYIIDIPEVLPTITAFKGYYQIKNNGNSKYANIAGRKTMNFTGAPESAPGTVIWLETNDKGQVQSLRSQGADLQGYAERAMRYVPTMVKLVVDKLHAEGAGEILGENGYDEIMAKFDSCFDYHLYVEQVGGSWRIYGKTPSMQPVVDFYREHTHQVETKLPDLEGFINKVLKKLRDRIGGESIFTDFSVRQIWENMNVTLTEPVDSASTMTFYREVLNNKNYVWDFAYQTAQIYWNNVKHHPRYDELIRGNLGEYADYLDEFVNQIHPDFKYYIIQRGDEPDYISEGNKEIRDGEAHTLWTIEDRPDFTVNIAGDQFGCPYGGGIGGYATTLYTDFAYTLPNEVTAYKVTAVKNGVATLAALSGIIPAQTPVLLIADAQGDYTLTLSTTAGTKVTGNLLCGVDSLITRFQLKTPMLVTLFNAVQGIVGDDLYNEYVQPYEYLQLLYAGTVNNKYFWGLTQSDANLCVYMGDDDMEHCVFRNLDGGAFVDNGVAPKANKAFLVSEKDAAIRIASKGDVNHDGKIDIADVTTLISRVLKGSGSACEYCGDMDSDGSLTIADVTTLINLCLRQSIVLVPDNEGN